MEYAIEAENLFKTYKNRAVLNGFSLKVKNRHVFGLLGPNGAGKSTFIRIVSGLEMQDSGSLKIFGKEAYSDVRKQIGVAPQENAIYMHLSCMENLIYFSSLYGINEKEAKERALYLLESLRLYDKKDVQAQFLSGGMKRRLNLACALMHKPKIIILDEPTTGLDPTTRISMWDTMKEVVAEEDATLVITTHYMEEAEALCERIAFVNSGQVVAEGTLNELKKLVKREVAKVRFVPDSPKDFLVPIKKVKGVERITLTEHGMIVEGKEIAIEDISKVLKEHGETIVELSHSKPSLEDVFLKLTGSKLVEVSKIEPNK